jgi:hypothetical protein
MQYEENKTRASPAAVMPALVAGIHVLLQETKDVDGRVKPGHDEGRFVASHTKGPGRNRGLIA